MQNASTGYRTPTRSPVHSCNVLSRPVAWELLNVIGKLWRKYFEDLYSYGVAETVQISRRNALSNLIPFRLHFRYGLGICPRITVTTLSGFDSLQRVPKPYGGGPLCFTGLQVYKGCVSARRYETSWGPVQFLCDLAEISSECTTRMEYQSRTRRWSVFFSILKNRNEGQSPSFYVWPRRDTFRKPVLHNSTGIL